MVPTGVKVEKGLRPMFSTGSANVQGRSSGFMLLDMALALTILLLLFAVVWPTFGGGTGSVLQSAAALDIATLLRADRTSASRDGVPTSTRIDLRRRTVTDATSRRVEVPPDIAIEVTTAGPCMRAAQQFIIVFAPDGSSCGGVIMLRKGAKAQAIRINWLSGMIDVVNVPKT
jgi:general secretion pathway protein H